jgi:iron(III) transport system ATP-binding protein
VTLAIRGVVKRFGALTALDAVDLDIEQGELVCFLGPSGCGKTTLLRVIAGLETADAGAVLLDGADLIATPARLRNFGVVFQSYSLFPNRDAGENIAYGLECRRWAKDRIRARVAEMLQLIGLADHAGKLPSQLSGGQQQRVALARALAVDPALLLLDEPLSALDAKVREGLRFEIRALQQRLGITTIMVTHDQEEALTMADRIVVMRAGRIEQVGTAAELYDHPETRFVAEFVGRINVLPVAPDGGVCGRLMALPEGRLAGRRPALVGIRPEAVRVHAPEVAPAGALGAQLEQAIFLGNLTQLVLRVEGAPEGDPPLLAELHGLRPDGFAPGAPFAVELPPAALRVLEWR